MTRSIRSIVVASLLLVGLSDGPARAANMEEAKLHFDRAETAYKLGQFQEAIREYEAAYRAMPDPSFLFNIAQAHRQQYRADKQVDHLNQALALYRSYLRELPEAPNRETVRKLIDELQSLLAAVQDRVEEKEKKPAQLVLRGEGAEGGQVTVDGTFVGTMPLSHSVKPGAHLVKVTKAGYKPWSSSVSLAGGATVDLPVTLEPVERTAAPSRPVYKKWWFWTIVGAVVAGGAGTGIYFATRGDDIPSMPEIDLR